MTSCPICLGDGEIDCRDSDAVLGELYDDRTLDLIRGYGVKHPVGVVGCDECDGTGEITEARAREIAVWATAMVDQAEAELARRESEGRS